MDLVVRRELGYAGGLRGPSLEGTKLVHRIDGVLGPPWIRWIPSHKVLPYIYIYDRGSFRYHFVKRNKHK